MVLTRPDGILIAGVILIFNWRYYKPLLLLIPLLALRYFYYGDLLPNPYYVKSGGGFYFSQGFYYIWVYISIYLSTFLLLYGFRFIKRREIALPMAIIFAYLILFVARVGGDFMYARFIIPVIPLIYFVIEQSFKEFKNVSILVGILIFSVVIEYNLRTSLFYDEADQHKPAFELDGITDESWYWSHDKNGGLNGIEIDRLTGKAMGEFFGDRHFVILLRSQCALAYYLGIGQTCIMSEGLTDKYIAKLPSEGRGRIGHERIAPIEYIRQRGCNFLFNRKPLGAYYGVKIDRPRFTLRLTYEKWDIDVTTEILTLNDSVRALFQ